MRRLLDSSWMKFGPAMRDSLDWPEPSALPSTDKQLADQSSGDAVSPRSVSSIAMGCLSLLALIGLLLFLLWRRRRGLEDSKLGLAGVIALEDLQDPEKNCELLSSLRRNASQRRSQRRGGSPLPSSSSEQDVNDGVFLMVYLPPPYEHTLTRIARAASMSSRDGDDPPHSPSLEPPSSPGLQPPSSPSVVPLHSPGLKRHASSPSGHRANLSPSPRRVSDTPGVDPSRSPGVNPSRSPGVNPSRSPGGDPSRSPGVNPSRSPGGDPSRSPRVDSSHSPGVDPSRSPGVDPSCSPGVDPPRSPGVDPPRSPGVDPPHTPGVDPPRSPGVDPPYSPGPLMSFSPGPETGAHPVDEIIEESETHH